MASPPPVAIIMGSQSDWATMKGSIDTLESLGIPCEPKVISAHRNPERLHDYVTGAKAAGIKVLICGAGMAAALPGVVVVDPRFDAYTALAASARMGKIDLHMRSSGNSALKLVDRIHVDAWLIAGELGDLGPGGEAGGNDRGGDRGDRGRGADRGRGVDRGRGGDRGRRHR